MDRKVIFYVLATAVLGYMGVLMMTPEQPEDTTIRFPWVVSQDPQGRTQVFGFTIGKTTLADVRAVFAEEGKINLFLHAEREAKYSVEAYFDDMYLNGLRADFVLSLDVEQRQLEPMYRRGLRISQLSSGAKKIRLAPEDIEVLSAKPLHTITYLPWKSLDAAIIENRFGKPQRMLTEPNGVTHWLYPSKGMDIGLDTDGGVVIQYVNPAAFPHLVAPLERGLERTDHR